MSIVVPVIGSPRTGTSLVSSILHALGCPMGERWVEMPDASWSPDHFWADAEFAELHRKLLTNGRDIDLAYGMTPTQPAFLLDYLTLVQNRESRFPLWGLKDFWLPILWPNLLPLFTHTIKPIFLTRDPVAARQSYFARKFQDIPTENDAQAILQPFQNAVATIKLQYVSALVIDFDQLVNQPVAQVALIAAYLGVPVTPEAVAKVLPAWRRF